MSEDSTLDLWFAALKASWVPVAIVLAVYTIAAMLIARKAGYSHWLGVVAVLVPGLGLVVVIAFAFLKWPALRERDEAVTHINKTAPKPSAK